jgi:FMN phosphatase YigB (HAD superfamily)
MTRDRAWTARLAVVLGIGAAIFAAPGTNGRSNRCGKPWVFFDLGNTLIVADPSKESRYMPGAHAYVQELHRHGVHVGLISNVPEKWGTNRTQKLKALKKIVADTWTKDSGAESMDWADFPDPTIFIPPRDVFRKPEPYLFRSAFDKVILEEGTRNCPVYYQGEDPLEVAVAEKVGMIGYVAHRDPAAPFLPVERIEHP